ncbi:hypothetical protein LR48_Vigan04g242400 [Vigna angularis]|uniref:Increased DNA methylation 1 n=2 Tax=Phaseolus angularis TaxID=3914 RepID=A0A0L9UHQ5_PHAAN|nr:increased DNA methylation 1 [Vigna angularis]KAG2400499.1 Increased DNA methylation 1 [Vigna angularis]KOM42226.1 hypothetical protein LR48_Vigan04g242400 [Vigna angularis]
MAPTPEPPRINIEPEYCPQAVTQWYHLASLPSNRRECSLRRDLSLKAKKHLRYLGWKFWYVEKKDKWEMRYTSPITDKNYISLARACKACIEEGGCIENPQDFQENNVVLEYPTSSSQPNKETRESKKRTRVCKKREKDDHDDELVEGSSSTNGRRGKAAPSIKTTTQEGEAPVSKSSQQHRGTLIPWLIENGAVGLDSVVSCRGSNGVVKKGKLLYGGICCDCCDKFFSPTRFEAHARCQRHRPNSSIFLEDGRSLLDCKNEALSSQQNGFVKEDEIDECGYPNDSTCAVCRYGGELVLCDGCPSSFHLKCLGLSVVPDGDWFCPVCCCKICRRPRCRDDRARNVGVNSILVCPQCERKFHFGCLKAPASSHTKLEKEEDRVGDRNWFCSRDCEEIFFGLQELLGKTINVDGDDVTWTLLKAVKRDSSGEDNLNLDGDEGLSENERKLSVALDVLRGSFDPIIDAFSGRDVIADVVFSRGSELGRLNFRGFYTVVLEREKEVISAATVRILGKRVAEIPFVATRMQCRRQGMCSMLMNEIEKQLSYLGVERLVLPSSCSAINTWTKSFDFVKMKPSDKSKLLDFVFLSFEGTIMCHKPLLQETYV